MKYASWLRVALSLLVTWTLAVYGQTVDNHRGNLYLRDKDGVRHQLTTSGRDCDPALSPDKTRTVFVRRLGERPNDDTGGTPVTATSELWFYDLVHGQAPQKLLDSPVTLNGHQYYAFHNPQFSTSNEYIYFLIDFAATSPAIARLEAATKQVVLIADALRFLVVPDGKYKDYLVAQQHRAKLAPGYFDWFWLLKPSGEAVGVIGEDENDVNLFLEMYSGNFERF